MELVVKDVHVTLGKAKIVNGVSLHVGERQSVGIIGPNGCGKSTLLKAIYRVNPIDSGEVLLNGQNVTKMSPKEAARHIAVVGQFNELAFDFSVQDMVLMGRSPHKKMMESYSEADYKLVEDTLRKTELYPLRQRSYLSLSGGEKQRISIARAFLKDAPIILLDEATASLDVENETAIQGALSRLIKNKTVLIIAHRMRTVAGADQVVVLSGGIVAEQGSPAELYARKGLYAHMVDLQSASQNWTI